MLYGGGVLFVLELGLVVYCVLNIITTPADAVRNLPKLIWLVLVLLFPIVGGIAWLVAGRPRVAAPRGGTGKTPVEYDRPGRATTLSPDDDDAFLRRLKERADEQRRTAERERRTREAGPDT